MDLLHNPLLLDSLASAYALGSLRDGARRRFEHLAREHPSVRAAALLWQGRLHSLGELQTQATPDPAVWTRIDNLVQAERAAQALQLRRQASTARPIGLSAWWHSLLLWRSTATAATLATVFMLVLGWSMRNQMGDEIQTLQAKLATTPQTTYVAVLADAQSSARMLVTFDPTNQRLTLQRVGDYQEADDRSLQLWALPPTGGPRSLGVLGRDTLARLNAQEADVHAVPLLAISLEPKGGVPSAGGPTGPVLFKGALIQRQM